VSVAQSLPSGFWFGRFRSLPCLGYALPERHAVPFVFPATVVDLLLTGFTA
jgi:hypothetical protein